MNAQTNNVTRKRSQKQTTMQTTTSKKRSTTSTPAKKQTTTKSSSQRSSSSTIPSSQSPTIGNSTYTPNIKTYYANGVSFQMVEVQGGTFRMGGTSEQGTDARSDEKPIHSVTLNSYYIGRTEVTQALWEAVMGESFSQMILRKHLYSLGKGNNYPMYAISWNECKTFISKLNAITGKNFRMPTEAEWEFAARGGTKSKGYKYSGSNTLDNVAWWINNSNFETHEVGTKSPNELGIYDMSGNVSEPCSDWYGNYSSRTQTDPSGAGYGSYHVFRGSNMRGFDEDCRLSRRGVSFTDPDRTDFHGGLRLCFSE